MDSSEIEEVVGEAIEALSGACDEAGSEVMIAIGRETGHALVLVRRDEDDPAAALEVIGQIIAKAREGEFGEDVAEVMRDTAKAPTNEPIH